MKTPNFKDPLVRRLTLYGALVAALAVNFNYNPEATHLAKEEYLKIRAGAIELAESLPVFDDRGGIKSNDLDVTGVSNKDVDGTQAHILSAETHTESNGQSGGKSVTTFKVTLKKGSNTQGEVCYTCLDALNITMPTAQLTDITKLRDAINTAASEAIAVQLKNKPTQTADVAKTSPDNKDKEKESSHPSTTAYSRCHHRDRASRMSCQENEMDDLTEKCDDMEDDIADDLSDKEERIAQRKVDACRSKERSFFTKYLGPSIQGGLSARPGTRDFQMAAAARNHVMESLNPGDGDIGAQLITATTNGSLNRIQQVYDNCMQMNAASGKKPCTPAIAQKLVRNATALELNTVGPGLSQGLQYSSFLDDGNGNMIGSDQAFSSSFRMPLQKVFTLDMKNGFSVSDIMQQVIDSSTDLAATASIAADGTPKAAASNAKVPNESGDQSVAATDLTAGAAKARTTGDQRDVPKPMKQLGAPKANGVPTVATGQPNAAASGNAAVGPTTGNARTAGTANQ